jgi:hypothetical protein
MGLAFFAAVSCDTCDAVATVEVESECDVIDRAAACPPGWLTRRTMHVFDASWVYCSRACLESGRNKHVMAVVDRAVEHANQQFDSILEEANGQAK